MSLNRTSIRALIPAMLGVAIWYSGVRGNDTGGIIPYANYDRLTATEMAAAHCARFNKLTKATAVDPQYGGYYSFACIWPHKATRSYATTRSVPVELK